MLFMASGLCHLSTRAQSCEFSLGADTVLCHGQHLFMHPPVGPLTQVWSTGSPAWAETATTSGTYWCMATFPQVGSDLVQNGDFSEGQVDFTSDLTVGTGGTWGLLSLEGTYGISTDPSLLHSNFASCGDHTGGGQMLIVNGSAQASANVWCQTVPVQPNTTYAFSSWIMSVTVNNPAVMAFGVNGVNLGTPLLATSNTCEWLQFYSLWNSGTATTATICINNQNLAEDGNDFALDDITFSPLCTWTDSINVTILPEAPEVEAGGDGALCPGSTADVEATLVPEGWLLPVNYAWSTGASTAGITVNGPGIYQVTASGRCLNSTASVVFTEDTCTTLIAMPNVFSPNGDGVNDTFGPIVLGSPQSFTMEIRNHWGQVVYTSTNVASNWSGRAEGGPVPAGTYFWTIRYGARQDDGSVQEHDEAGNVTLVRAN